MIGAIYPGQTYPGGTFMLPDSVTVFLPEIDASKLFLGVEGATITNDAGTIVIPYLRVEKELQITGNTNGLTEVHLTNIDGTSAYTSYAATAGTSSFVANTYSQSYSGAMPASSSLLYGGSAGGLGIIAGDAAGDLWFAAGGTTVGMRLTAEQLLELYGVGIAINEGDLVITKTVGETTTEVFSVAHATGNTVILGTLTLGGVLLSLGANDSAGAGYRLVRVPNA